MNLYSESQVQADQQLITSRFNPYSSQRMWDEIQVYAVPDSFVSAPRFVRLRSQIHSSLPPDSLTGIGSRRKDMGAQEADCNAERMASALESRALKIQRKSSLAVAPSQRKFALRQHNHLLRRQHCSSLCSQSEGHEHVANMTNALGHDFVGFSARAWPPQYSPPHFASKVSYNAGAATSDCVDQRKFPLRGCYRRPFIFPNFAHLCLSANAGAEANASGSRDERVWEQRRTHTGWCSPKGIGAEAEAMFFRLSARFPADTNKS